MNGYVIKYYIILWLKIFTITLFFYYLRPSWQKELLQEPFIANEREQIGSEIVRICAHVWDRFVDLVGKNIKNVMLIGFLNGYADSF